MYKIKILFYSCFFKIADTKSETMLSTRFLSIAIGFALLLEGISRIITFGYFAPNWSSSWVIKLYENSWKLKRQLEIKEYVD